MARMAPCRRATFIAEVVDYQPGPHLRYHDVFWYVNGESQPRRHSESEPGPNVPFVLFAFPTFLGGQRYAATWTGDNKSTWEHFKLATPMILTMGLSGQPFLRPRFRAATKEARILHFLPTGWLLAPFYPFCRNHTEIGSANQEPWAFW